MSVLLIEPVTTYVSTRREASSASAIMATCCMVSLTVGVSQQIWPLSHPASHLLALQLNKPCGYGQSPGTRAMSASLVMKWEELRQLGIRYQGTASCLQSFYLPSPSLFLASHP